MTRLLTLALISLVIAASSTTANARHRYHQHAHSQRVQSYVDANGSQVIGARPAGCPHAYCGCGLRKYLGIDDTRLDLAWNWTKYYRGDRAVAVWHHHVALIEQMVGPGEALLRDYNSGGGLSRLHIRSIAGAVIVNRGFSMGSVTPHELRIASQKFEYSSYH